jgi:hypothetical protein
MALASCHRTVAQNESKAVPTGVQNKTAQRDAKQASVIFSYGKRQEGSIPPGYSTGRTGSMHDFDYFVGGWRRLKTRGVGSNEWEEFPGNLWMSLYLDGMVTVDELYFSSKGSAGLTLRTFDPQKRQWSIYWVSSLTGKFHPVPVVGGFEGNRRDFYAEDQDQGRPVKVRYTWNKLDHGHARWEQAFS